MDFLKDVIKEIGGDYTRIAEQIQEDEVYVDTGSYVLNGLISGSLLGGVSDNKITAFSGIQGSGKTFFSLAVVKSFLDNNPHGYCLYFDTESAVTKKLLSSRNIDLSRVIVVNVVTIEEFRTKALKVVDLYMKTAIEDRKPCLFVLDSLGMLSTNKEIKDTLDEKDVKDMTKAGLIKAAFRMLTLNLGKANIPLIVTNHIYANVSGYGAKTVQSGGCLAAGTKIFTRSGYKNIEDLIEGDFVFTKEGVFKPVLETHNFKNKELVEIEFDDGYKVTCSLEHKFMINGDWVDANELKIDDCVLSIN